MSSVVIKTCVSVHVPKPPSFLQTADNRTVPLSAVTEDGLRQVGQMWTEALVELANEQRRGSKNAND